MTRRTFIMEIFCVDCRKLTAQEAVNVKGGSLLVDDNGDACRYLVYYRVYQTKCRECGGCDHTTYRWY